MLSAPGDPPVGLPDGLPEPSDPRGGQRQRRWLTVEAFPAYAPELNPVEHSWARVAGTDLTNFSTLPFGPLRASGAT
jgi:hypothetical protein